MLGISMVFFMGARRARSGGGGELFGAPISVIIGGLGCLIATGWVAASTPAIRRYRRGRK
jgi:hypothetical protein